MTHINDGHTGLVPMEIPARSEAVFETMFVEEYPAMVALAAAVSGSRLNAEDIAQDALTRLHQNWEKVSGLDKPGAWLRRVTINLALNKKQRRRTEGRALRLVGATASTASLPAAPAEDAHIWTTVAKLPKMQRAVVSLHFLEGRSLADIAQILEISDSTARVHLHRARKTLHQTLTQTPEATR